jgi:6-phosphogluconolactonase
MPSAMTHEALEIAESPQAAANACAAWILEDLRDLLVSADSARIAISGGSTPKMTFETLGRTPFSWSKVHIFWVDERCVPPTDSQSNYKLASETLLEPAGIPAGNIHRIKGELEPPEAAEEYVRDIRSSFNLSDGQIPVFDLIHRGLGPDAHTASLFPGEPLIGDRKGVAASVYVQKLKMHRVTLLPAVLLAARKTVVLAAGDDKAEPLFQVLRGPEDPFLYPCQLGTRGSLKALWFIDRAAAQKL